MTPRIKECSLSELEELESEIAKKVKELSEICIESPQLLYCIEKFEIEVGHEFKAAKYYRELSEVNEVTLISEKNVPIGSCFILPAIKDNG